MEIVWSARRHGIPDEDILHGLRNAVVIEPIDDDLVLYLAPLGQEAFVFQEAPMAEHGRTRSGKPITDELVAGIAERAESGFDVEAIVDRRRGGRPALGTGPASVESVRLDPDLRAALIRRAEAEHSTPSAVIREALRRYLDVA